MKRYVDELGSDAVRSLLNEHTACTSRLSEVEIASALARREREGFLETTQRDRALAAMVLDMDRLFVVELESEITAIARKLLLTYPLRAGDATQLGSAIYLKEQTMAEILFVSYDASLNNAARSSGLTLTKP